MAFLTESQVRAVADSAPEVVVFKKAFDQVISEAVKSQASKSSFDIFLSHSIKDSRIVLGAKKYLERAGKTVYVDWIEDPALDRTKVTGATAEKLRTRMRQCRSLLYLYSQNSQASRWMPWELGYFDGYNGNVAVFPIVPDNGKLDYTKEEYLQIYPKVDFANIQGTATMNIWINKDSTAYNTMDKWMISSDKLRPTT